MFSKKTNGAAVLFPLMLHCLFQALGGGCRIERLQAHNHVRTCAQLSSVDALTSEKALTPSGSTRISPHPCGIFTSHFLCHARTAVYFSLDVHTSVPDTSRTSRRTSMRGPDGVCLAQSEGRCDGRKACRDDVRRGAMYDQVHW